MRILDSTYDMFQCANIGRGDMIVIPVNLVGVMGKGVALYAKKNYRWVFPTYQAALTDRMLDIGKNYYINNAIPQFCLMATKRHWKDDSRKEDVVAGLVALKKMMKKYPDQYVHLPAVGCGEGNLSFEWLVEQCWTLFTGMNIDVYSPR